METEPSASAHRSRVLILAVLFLVVVGLTAGFFAWRHQVKATALRMQAEKHEAEVAARRKEAQARLDALTKKQAHITDLEAQYAILDDSYKTARDEASAAMQARHDSTNYDSATAQAKKELTEVKAMQDALPTLQSSINDLLDACADALGESAVTTLRANADQVVQLEGLSLSRHWRAINDITDALTKVDRTSDITTEDVERDYDESSDYETRAATHIQEFMRQWIGLQGQLQKRIDAAQHDLGNVTIYAICSHGASTCGASGDFFDETRPQDLSYAQAYRTCLNGNFFKASSNAETRNKCAAKEGIYKIQWISNYSGPLVNVFP